MSGVFLAETAKSWIGTPWQWCAREKGKGCDCAGLVLGVLKECGLCDWRPANYSEDFSLEQLLSPLNRLCWRVWHEPGPGSNREVILRPGDILLFTIKKRPQHLGIATDHDRFVHAYQTAGKVVESELDGTWANRLMSVYKWKERG